MRRASLTPFSSWVFHVAVCVCEAILLVQGSIRRFRPFRPLSCRAHKGPAAGRSMQNSTRMLYLYLFLSYRARAASSSSPFARCFLFVPALRLILIIAATCPVDESRSPFHLCRYVPNVQSCISPTCFFFSYDLRALFHFRPRLQLESLLLASFPKVPLPPPAPATPAWGATPHETCMFPGSSDTCFFLLRRLSLPACVCWLCAVARRSDYRGTATTGTVLFAPTTSFWPEREERRYAAVSLRHANSTKFRACATRPVYAKV